MSTLHTMSKKTVVSKTSMSVAGIGAVFLSLVLSMLTACNSDVFVKEFEVSPLDMSVEAGGGVLETRFSSGGWKVVSALVNGSFADCVTWIGDGKYYHGCPSSMDGVDSIQIKNPAGTVCTMSRNGRRTLQMKMAENLASSPRYIVVVVSDDIFNRNIHVAQAAGAGNGWMLDRVEWAAELESSSVVLEPKGEGLTVVNTGTEDVVVHVNIFDGCTREVHFIEDASAGSEGRKITGDAEIPDGRLKNGTISFSGVRVPYGNYQQELEIPLPDAEVKVNFKPGRHTCQTIIEYEEYDVRFKAVFKTAAGSTMKKEGHFRSKTPTGTWYITKPE